MKKPITIIFSLLLFFAAYLQLNDPDSALWVAIYSLAGAISLTSAFKQLPKKFYLIIAALCLIWAATLSPAIYKAIQNNTNLINSEEARELFGLIIIAIWNLFLGKIDDIQGVSSNKT